MRICCKTIKNRVFPLGCGKEDSAEDRHLDVGQNQNRHRRGTSLIEVMIGLLILVILAVSVVRGIAYPRFLVVSAAHKQAAIQAANEALEVVLSKGYSFASARLGEAPQSLVDLDNMGDLVDRYAVNGRTISGSWSVMPWDGETPPILQVTVSVDYPGGDSPVVLDTLVSP